MDTHTHAHTYTRMHTHTHPSAFCYLVVVVLVFGCIYLEVWGWSGAHFLPPLRLETLTRAQPAKKTQTAAMSAWVVAVQNAAAFRLCCDAAANAIGTNVKVKKVVVGPDGGCSLARAPLDAQDVCVVLCWFRSLLHLGNVHLTHVHGCWELGSGSG